MFRVIVSFSLASIVFLIGCGTGIAPDSLSTSLVPAIQGVQGMVHGGQQPVTSAAITLWAVGTTGYGSTPTSLATASTSASGTFTLPTYTCPAADPYVYITASGGNPGLGVGTNNSALLLMAALTDCNTLKTNASTTFINIDEVTTVAAAYALAQFMNASTGAIGSYAYVANTSTTPYTVTGNTGLINAFNTANNMVSTTTGSALATTPGGNGVVPQQEIDTLADILVPCVNSTGPGSSACTSLFGDVAFSPGNTLLAALSIALHPAYNVPTIFGLATANAAFQPTLPTNPVPNDFTVALAFSINANGPRSIAVDGSGNVWTANNGTTGSSVSKLSPLGVVLASVTTNFNGNAADTLAIDAGNDVWVGNYGSGTLVGLDNNGNTLYGPISGFNEPLEMAFDPYGYLWVANAGTGTVAEYNTNYQTFISPQSGYAVGTLSSPSVGLAMDSSGDAWISAASGVVELNPYGSTVTGSPFTGGGISSPMSTAIDGSNDVWISNGAGGGKVAELSNTGTVLSGTGFNGGGVNGSNIIAIDGGGNVWLADRNFNQLAELNSAGTGITPTAGYEAVSLSAPRTLAIDGSGNVWVGDLTTTTTGSLTTTISEFIGVAVPTVTPQSIALAEGEINVEPGTPVPISINSGALPYYTPGSNYSAQLYASGGNSNLYTWSISSGSLPSPLTLSAGSTSSEQLISGTTSVTGTTTFAVKVADTENPSNFATKTFTLTANSTLTALGNEAALAGSYAMQFSGFKNGTQAADVFGSDFVASVTFNGSGTLSGEIDTNVQSDTSAVNSTLTGYYTFGSGNRGTMVIIPSASGAKPMEFAFAGSNFSGSTPQTLQLIEFDDTIPATGGGNLAIGAGTGKLQSGAAFNNTTLGQSFVFGLQGETPCNNVCVGTLAIYGPITAAGKFTANTSNTVVSGEEDAAAVNTSYNGITLSGSYTSPDSSGRGTLTLTPSGTLFPDPPSHYAYYIVGSGEMYIMSTDGHKTNSMLSGDVLAQTGSFSDSTLTGSYVAYAESGSNGDGQNIYPNSTDSFVGLLTVQSGDQLALVQDENQGYGSVKLEQSQGPFTYSIDSNGRMTLTGGGGGQPIFYLANGTQAFGTMQPSSTNNGGPGLIFIAQQIGGSFGCGAPTGTFGFGTIQSPISLPVYSGVANLSTEAFTIDESYYGITLQGQTGTIACASDSMTATTGRVVLSTSLGSSFAVYPIVPNGKYVMLPIETFNTQPSVIVLEK